MQYTLGLTDHLGFLIRLYVRPASAMGAILDRGSLLFASLSVLVIALLEDYRGLSGGIGFYVPLLVLAAIYVPGVLVLSRMVAGLHGALGAVFRRDYSPLLTCAAMAWSAANLPVLAALWILPSNMVFGVAGAAIAYFLVLMFLAVRAVFGTSNGSAAVVICLSWIPLLAAILLREPLQFLMGWLASPFFLLYAWFYLGSEIGSLGEGLRRRQNFQRMLHAAAVNPHDAGAQYQLGLVYQERRQLTEAVAHFQRAVSIDPTETDAHFQLGRIARTQGRLKDALAEFQIVINQDENHHQSEILRELGALYLTARQLEDACRELADYTEKRPWDPEGLYYFGQALEGLNRKPEAREKYTVAIDAARTAPPYRRRELARWSRLAEKQLKGL